MLFLAILFVIIIWVLIGFIAFLIECRVNRERNFNSELKRELMACVRLGGIAFLMVIYDLMVDWFNSFMNWLLKKINN